MKAISISLSSVQTTYDLLKNACVYICIHIQNLTEIQLSVKLHLTTVEILGLTKNKHWSDQFRNDCQIEIIQKTEKKLIGTEPYFSREEKRFASDDGHGIDGATRIRNGRIEPGMGCCRTTTTSMLLLRCNCSSCSSCRWCCGSSWVRKRWWWCRPAASSCRAEWLLCRRQRWLCVRIMVGPMGWDWTIRRLRCWSWTWIIRWLLRRHFGA